MKIRIIAGDITHYSGDVIVNAANEVMLGGGGVDGAIHRAAGPELKEACRAVYVDASMALGAGGCEVQGKRCPVGSVRPTPAFNLDAKWVFHTVGPVWPVGCEKDRSCDGSGMTKGRSAFYDLYNCYLRCLQMANVMDLESLAFPAISTGVYGCPHEICAKVAARACKEVFSLDLTVTFHIHPAEHLGTWFKVFEEAAKDEDIVWEM